MDTGVYDLTDEDGLELGQLRVDDPSRNSLGF